MKLNTRDLVILAVLIALSFILANIKVAGSIALDSAPAFLALFVYKDYRAAIVGSIGHLLSASLSGFALGLPVHLIIAATMAIMLLIAAWLIKKFNQTTAFGFIFIFNVMVAPLPVFLIMPFSQEVYLAFFIALAPATLLSLVIAGVLTKPTKQALRIYD